jgi:hypothetical protein
VPVCRIACQPGDLQPKNNTGAPQTDLRYQTLKALAIGSGGPRLSQIGIDDGDLILSPAQSDCMLAKRILPLGAFGVLQDLTQRRLPDVEISRPFQVRRFDLLMYVRSHGIPFETLFSNIVARSSTTSERRPDGNGWAGCSGRAGLAGAASSP